MSEARFILFAGKGGVGKTTMASAAAVHYATQGSRTLIVTTDPASNLGDVFEQEIGHKITPIEGIPGLSAMEIDPDKSAEQYRERVLAPLRAVMPPDVIRVVEEQFRSPCATEIASFDRFVDFMDRPRFDVVIFDTAPTGHTLRLLELPVDWSRHIDESARGTGQTCIGPVQAIQDSKAKYDAAMAALRNPAQTSFVFVLTPEKTSIHETLRATAELRRIGIQSFELIVNGVLPAEACAVPFFRRRYEMQQGYLRDIASRFRIATRRMLLRDNEVKGVKALRSVARDLYGEARQAAGADPAVSAEPAGPAASAPLPRATDMAKVRDLLRPSGGRTRLLFFTGKGGVGKTTVSCVTALETAGQGCRTLLVTTDPAAHIGEVLERHVEDTPLAVKGVPNLWAVMINQEKAVKAYKERLLAEARTRYSEDLLAAMKEELDSPCTEEMAAFDRFASFAESDEYDVIVFDTAPTGHTLRLLELPFDYSRQVEVMVTTTAGGRETKSETQERFDRLIRRLRDPKRTVFAFVVYPEATPVVEAYRAMLDLADAGIQTQLVVANQVLPAEHCSGEFFARRRAMQEKYLAEIRRRFQTPVLILPLLETEVRGLAALEEARRLLFGARPEGRPAGGPVAASEVAVTPVTVRVFGAPTGSCGPTWEGAASMLRQRLATRFGDRALVEYVELFTPRSFEFPEILAGIKAGNLGIPVVTVSGEIIPARGKLPVSRIEQAVDERLGHGEAVDERPGCG